MALRWQTIFFFLLACYFPSIVRYIRHFRFFKTWKDYALNFSVSTIFALLILFAGIRSQYPLTLRGLHLLEVSLYLYALVIIPMDLYWMGYALYGIIKRVFHRKQRIWAYLGGFMAALVAGVLLVGFIERHDYMVRVVEIPIEHLPEAFEGYTIAQISDAHLGSSFIAHKFHQEIIDTIKTFHPDLFVFTGDMVNNYAFELDDAPDFSQIKAKDGAFAIMGNHDYGDYSSWTSSQAKFDNLQAIEQGIRHMGFTLLNDSAVFITRGASCLALIGVQNCGVPPFFKCYGDLRTAYREVQEYEQNKVLEPIAAQILLSHDPSHWDYEVREGFPDIDLMLSGHTHGAQFGLKYKGFRWSPSQYIFKEWNGLYTDQDLVSASYKPNKVHYLYVNVGLGYVGIPFRFGMKAEVSIIRLVKPLKKH